MCQEDNSSFCDHVGVYYCPCWDCVSWANWQKTKHAALLQKGMAAPDYTSDTFNPEILLYLSLQLETRTSNTITNKTARAINLLTKQSTKICNTIYQNCLTLDYLLASKGEVRDKFNLSNCCLQNDDEGKVIKKKTDKMRKIVNVPI
jgi:hypothetical protein